MWFWKKEEKRNRLDESGVDALLRGRGNDEAISKQQALNIPAIGTSLNFIGAIIGMIPIKLYKKENGIVTEVINDQRLKILNSDTGDLLDAYQFKKAMVEDYLLTGAAYAYVNMFGNSLKSLHYIESQSVSINKKPDPIFKKAEFIVNGQKYRDFQFLRITHTTSDGVTGEGILKRHQILFSAMYNALRYENRTMGSGTKKGFLKSAAKLEEKVMRQLREAWRKLTQNQGSDVMVLNSGIEFQEAGTTAVESQLSQNKEINTTDVYAIFGINNNLFSQKSPTADAYQATIKTAILPIAAAFETAINKFLLLEKEKTAMFFKLDTDAVMKTEILDRYKAYEIAAKNGWIKTDEIRAKENMKPLGIKFVRLGLDTVLFDPVSGDVYTANTGIKTNINHQSAVETILNPTKEGDKVNENRNPVKEPGDD